MPVGVRKPAQWTFSEKFREHSVKVIGHIPVEVSSSDNYVILLCNFVI